MLLLSTNFSKESQLKNVTQAASDDIVGDAAIEQDVAGACSGLMLEDPARTDMDSISSRSSKTS